MIYIGTSGYAYTDWKGIFYPETLSSKNYLQHYAKHFDAVELNFSYYKMPTAKQTASMVEQTDGKMLFAVKAHQSFTHQRTASKTEFDQFCDAMRPLQEADVLGAILLQFPHSFHQVESNRSYLQQVSTKLPFPLIAEFRNANWATTPIYSWLSKLNVGYCCVDEPALPGLMPKTNVTTANIGYIRFHGRNSAKWYAHNHAFERYDYKYSASELKEWIPAIDHMNSHAEKTMVFFNNHFQAKAVDGAKQLSSMLLQLKDNKR